MQKNDEIPYFDYVQTCEKIINLLKFADEVQAYDLDTYPADARTYDALGKPPVVNIYPDDNLIPRYIINCKDKNIQSRLFHLAILRGFDAAQESQQLLMDAILGLLKRYMANEKTAAEAMLDLYAFYVSSAYTFEETRFAVGTAAHLPMDKALHEETLKNLEMHIRDYGERVTAQHMETEQKEIRHNEEIAELNRKIKTINKDHHQEMKLVLDRLQDFALREIKWEKEKQELNNLRELMFLLMDGKYDTEIQDESIKLPHYSHKNIYVLGGHESWFKQIKQNLPDLKFIRDDHVNLKDKLPKADQVWFQVNALAHSRYYAATNITDKNHIPVRYFKHDSAKSCAIQFVQEYNK